MSQLGPFVHCFSELQFKFSFYQHLFILSDHFVHVERNHLDQLKRPSATYKMSLIKMLSIVIMWE